MVPLSSPRSSPRSLVPHFSADDLFALLSAHSVLAIQRECHLVPSPYPQEMETVIDGHTVRVREQPKGTDASVPFVTRWRDG